MTKRRAKALDAACARWWRVQNPRLSFRVARYSAEDKQMTDHWKDVTTREP